MVVTVTVTLSLAYSFGMVLYIRYCCVISLEISYILARPHSFHAVPHVPETLLHRLSLSVDGEAAERRNQ